MASYEAVLAFLGGGGDGKGGKGKAPAHEFWRGLPALAALFETMSAAAPATPGASDEEWNPLSQRPHAPLAPEVGDELGAELTALKEAVDGFTTLAHEMLHVALWEPFFTGRWRPAGKKAFHAFSVRAEGFCFFYADIVVTRAVRVRLPDGEFALERRTPSSATFAPERAFRALGIEAPDEILRIYLDGFSGGRTALWRPRGASNFAAALAAQVYDFYVGSGPYLDGLYEALRASGTFGEFYRDFCRIPGLPTFLGGAAGAVGGEMTGYFARFFGEGLAALAAAGDRDGVRRRRALQMRAHYALQLRWLVREGAVLAKGAPALARRVLPEIDAYLRGLRAALRGLAAGGRPDPAAAGERNAEALRAMAACDERYDDAVRGPLRRADAWAAHRWLIAPRRAGGAISLWAPAPARGREATVHLLRTVAFLVDELTRRMKGEKTVEGRAAVLRQLRGVAGATTGSLPRELKALKELWSVPLAAFDPKGNSYRELLFSYQ